MTGDWRPTEQTTEETSLQELAEIREVLYRLLSATFQRPGPELRLAIDAAGEIAETLSSFSEFGFVPPALELLNNLASVDVSNVAATGLRYDRLFAKPVATGGVPLEESAYLESGDDNSGWVLVAIERMYDSAGFAAQPQPGTTSDHISVQLEFLAALCGQEVDALANQDLGKARRSQARQARFVASHPIKWVHNLEALLHRHGDPLYTSAVRMAHSLLLHDYDLLDQTRDLMKSP